jgi:competence ComEA-like helix-hairpin-helix protein
LRKKRDYGKNEINETNESFRLFRFFRNLFFILILIFFQTTAYTQPERININTATIEELMRLPSIGPTLASRIIEHRRKHGIFKRPQEIIIIRGMSARRYRQIAHLIRI